MNSTSDQAFTTYDRDETSGTDYAMARHYRTRDGRFLTPDPGHVGGNVGDPQSWNAYAYSRNDPVNLVDPSGLRYDFCVLEFRARHCYEAADADFESIIGDQGYDLLGGRGLGDRGSILRNGRRRGDYFHATLDDPGGVVPGGGGGGGGGDDNGGGGSPTVTVTTGPFRQATPDLKLTNLLNQLSRCPFAFPMVADLVKLRNSGKLILSDLGPDADGTTSFLGTISIDINRGITARILGHEYFHTQQRRQTLLFNGGGVYGHFAWFGASWANNIDFALVKRGGHLGFLDQQAEDFGQKVSDRCLIE